MASNSSGCVHEWWREDLFPPSSHPHPFPPSLLGCCGNERADLRLLSPIVPVKLLNFSTRMTISQGRVRARKRKVARTHSHAHRNSRFQIKTYTCTPGRHTHWSWEKSAIYLVYWPQGWVVSLYWLSKRRTRLGEDNREDTLKGVPFFLLGVCLIEIPNSMLLWSCQAASPWMQSDVQEVHNALSGAPSMSIFFHSWINSCLYFGFLLLLLSLPPSIHLWQSSPKCLL